MIILDLIEMRCVDCMKKMIKVGAIKVGASKYGGFECEECCVFIREEDGVFKKWYFTDISPGRSLWEEQPNFSSSWLICGQKESP